VIQGLLHSALSWYRSGSRWWLPLILGLLYPLFFSPFNHETHPLLFLFPLTGFVALLPVFVIALALPLRRAILHLYLFGIAASAGQYYWIGFVAPEGQHHLILLGLLASCMILGIYFLVTGLVFRGMYRLYPRLYLFLFPSFWIILELVRGIGELAFPWNYVGYLFVPYTATAQLASVVGTFGLSWVVIFGNALAFEVLLAYYHNRNRAQKWLHLSILGLGLIVATVWGWMRMNGVPEAGERTTVSLIQGNLDQLHWGSGSLDSSLAILEEMVVSTQKDDPELVVLSESAVLTYLARRNYVRLRVEGWADSIQTPLIVGSLHWEASKENPYYRYLVYNSAFLVRGSKERMQPYHKIKLVPVSEIMPFEAQIPILSRVNLGEADFKRGGEPTVYRMDSSLKPAPFICYEIIFPSFVRKRVNEGANLLVNITNDGWFGRSSGPFQHAAMARMRTIENGVSMVRCANSGISMMTDQFGRVLHKTPLYTRTVATGSVPIETVDTLYRRLGDWPLGVAGMLLIVAGILLPSRIRRRSR
jgi:apolipoprotein N-acyltransferase